MVKAETVSKGRYWLMVSSRREAYSKLAETYPRGRQLKSVADCTTGLLFVPCRTVACKPRTEDGVQHFVIKGRV